MKKSKIEIKSLRFQNVRVEEIFTRHFANAIGVRKGNGMETLLRSREERMPNWKSTGQGRRVEIERSRWMKYRGGRDNI